MRAAAIAIAIAAAACAHAQVVAPRPAADFVRDTHAMLEAFDRGDAAAVAAITAPSFGFTHDPNQLLVTATAGVAPGAALDLATGQGRNALHLARAGWAVTAVDISDEGLRQAREAATRAHVALDTVQADIDAYDYGVAKWDLITEIYVPNPVARAAKIKAGLRPGGLFVLEFFLDEGDGGVKPAELRAQFVDGFDILRDEVVDDRPDWGQDRAKLVRFVARKR